MYEAGLGNKNWTTSVSGKRGFSWWGWISYLVGRPCLEALFHLDKVWWVTCHCPSGWVGNLCNKLCQRYNDFSHNPCTEFSMKLDISNFLTDELSGAKFRGYITYLPFLVLFCKYTFTFSSQPCVGVPKCIQSWELTVTWRILDPTRSMTLIVGEVLMCLDVPGGAATSHLCCYRCWRGILLMW